MNDDLAAVTRLCERLGAPGEQAHRMATQLLKRADQLAAERGVTRLAALSGLLEVLVRGRGGEVPPGFHAPPARE